MTLIEWYPQLRAIHMACAAASFALFVLRGAWMIRTPARLELRWVRIVPHVIDTALLGSAVLLAMTLRQYPFVDGWLTAKVLALVLYILLGTIALKRGPTKPVRCVAFASAILVFLYIASAARAHSPWPW